MKRIWILVLALIFASAAFAAEGGILQGAWDQAWRGDYPSAIKSYQKFARENPDDPSAAPALFNAASLNLEQVGNLAAARKDLLALVEKYPRNRYALQSYRLLAEIAAKENQPQEAVNFYRQGLVAAQKSEFQMPDTWISQMVEGLMSSLTLGDDPSRTAQIYQDLLPIIPPGEEAAEIHFNMAQAHKSAGQNDQAIATLKNLMLAYPFSRWTGRTLREEREFISAAGDFCWNDIENMSQVQGLSRAGSFQQVHDIAAEAVSSHANDPLGENAQYVLITSEVYLTSDFDAAIEAMQSYLDKYPNSLRGRDARRRIETWREIRGLLDDLADNPEDYSTHQQVGFALLQNGFSAQAAEHFEIAAADTSADDAYLGLGYSYMRLNRTPDAIASFERYLKSNPEDGTIYNMIGYAYLGSGELTKAEQCFARYKELEPNNPNSHDSYAECLMNSGKLDEAIAEYKEAIRINASFTNPYGMLGQIYIMKSDAASAREFLSKYLELDPSGILSAQARAQLDSLGQGN